MSHLTEQLLENLLNLELIDYLNVSASLSNQIEKLEDILSSLNNQGSKRRQIISSEDVGSNDPDMDVSIVEPCLTAKVCKESKFPSKRLLKLWLQDSNGALYTAMELRQLPLPEYPCLGLKVTS